MEVNYFHLCWIALILSYSAIHVTSGQEEEPNNEVQSLCDSFWQWRLQNSPELGTEYQLYTGEDKLGEFTEEAMTRTHTEAQEMLSRVKAISTTALNKQDKISVKILTYLLETYIKGYEYRVYGAYNPIGVMETPIWTLETLVKMMRFESIEDIMNWDARLHLIPKMFVQLTNLMLQAVHQNKTLNANSLNGVLEAFDDFLSQPVTESPFYLPYLSFPNNTDLALRETYQESARNFIMYNIKPVIEEMRDVINQTYLPNTRPLEGVSSLDGGLEYYQACLDWHLSVRMTPQEIHDIGLQEVARIKAEMEKIMQNAGFEGTLQEYIAFLKSKPENFYQTGDEMLTGYRTLVDQIVKKMSIAFESVTNISLRIERQPNKYAATGIYSIPSADGNTPGIFTANVFDVQNKPKFDMLALTLHETYPGHHLQFGHAIELGIPDFRRLLDLRLFYPIPYSWPSFNAYVEGWALYAEKLGEADTMNLFKDQDSLFGRYSSEIFRAARLVIDTGIHAFGWTKQQAKDYLAEHTTMADSSIDNEINRYITWPGQATSYKIGELKIIELRRKAEDTLGDKFNLKQFHKQILDLGPAPLSILDEVIQDWVTETLQSSAASHMICIYHVTLILTGLFSYTLMTM